MTSTGAEYFTNQVFEGEQDLSLKLWRDSLPAFSLWKDVDPAACRLIRSTCDIVGPRGNDKSCCQDCMSYSPDSKLETSSANRINNFFAGAAVNIYHRQIVIEFLKYKKDLNLK